MSWLPPKRLDETEAQYRQFRWWLEQDPRPPPPDPELASRARWADRAVEYDTIHSVPQDEASQLRDARAHAVLAMDLGMRKIVKRVTTGELVLEPLDIERLGKAAASTAIIASLVGDPAAVEAEVKRLESLSLDELRDTIQALDRLGARPS